MMIFCKKIYFDLSILIVTKNKPKTTLRIFKNVVLFLLLNFESLFCMCLNKRWMVLTSNKVFEIRLKIYACKKYNEDDFQFQF